jgi:hypothetical protein
MWAPKPDMKRSASKTSPGDPQPIMIIGNVWRILESGKWEPIATLREASGVDDDTLTSIINFLTRWNFLETERSPELLVRRKPGAVSPVETFELLNGISERLSIPKTVHRLAERLACRVCNGRDLSFVGANEVECNRCHEKQWYAVETPDSLSSAPVETEGPIELSLGERLLVRLGRPQKAYRSNIPKPTQYFWFRCNSCGKTSTDYAHGHSRYLTCPMCQTRNKF